jgi:hypothetical protein
LKSILGGVRDKIYFVRFEVFTAVKIQYVVFQVDALCSMVVGYHNFRGPGCLSLQD